MKKAVAWVLVGMMALGLAGCSKSTPAKTTSSANVKGSMTVLLSDEPTDDDPLSVAFKQWETQTGNKVEKTVIPYDDQSTKWPAMAKSGQVPDLMTTTGIHQLYQNDFVNMGKEFDMSDFGTAQVKLIGVSYTSSEITGLPIDESVTNFYYNKDAFAKAGLTAPTVNSDAWTWDQLYANAKLLQQKGGVKYGFACDFSRARYDNLMYAYGGSLLEKSGGKWVITCTQKPAVDALTFFVKMNNDGTMPKQIWAGGSTDTALNYFGNGDVGMLLSGCWNYASLGKSVTKFKWGVMVSPKQKVQSCISGGGAFAVPAKAQNKAVAMSFLKWFYTPQNYQSFINNDKQISVLKDVKYAPSNTADIENWNAMDQDAQNVTSAYVTDESANWRQYVDADYRTDLSKAVSGSYTPTQALEAFANELNQKSGWQIKK